MQLKFAPGDSTSPKAKLVGWLEKKLRLTSKSLFAERRVEGLGRINGKKKIKGKVERK